MAEKPNVPDALSPAYHQMLNLAPDVVRSDLEFQTTLLMYLKLGGPRLARHYIQTLNQPFMEDFGLVKRRTDDSDDSEEAEESGEAEEAEEAENEGDDADADTAEPAADETDTDS